MCTALTSVSTQSDVPISSDLERGAADPHAPPAFGAVRSSASRASASCGVDRSFVQARGSGDSSAATRSSIDRGQDDCRVGTGTERVPKRRDSEPVGKRHLAASANARYLSDPVVMLFSQLATMNTIVAATSSDVARIFILRRAVRRSRSAADITFTAATLVLQSCQTAAINSATSGLLRSLRMMRSRVGPRLPIGRPLILLIWR